MAAARFNKPARPLEKVLNRYYIRFRSWDLVFFFVGPFLQGLQDLGFRVQDFGFQAPIGVT